MTTNNTNFQEHANQALEQWRNEEKTALELLQITGELRFDRSIELVLFRNDIYDTRPSTLIHQHGFAQNYGTDEINVSDSLELAKAITNLKDLPPCRIDLGKLGLEWVAEKKSGAKVGEFVADKLSIFTGENPKNEAATDVVLYGFGRIGRLAARRIVASTGRGEQLRLKAIVIRPKLKDRFEEATKRAALLQSDSVHGEFPGNVEVAADGSELIINGNRVQLIYAGSPADIDYTAYGISNALIIDNTGVWRDTEGLSQHLRPGASHVLLTAPGKGEVANIVYGVNHEEDFNGEKVLSAASCTTNAIAPVLKVLHAELGIEKGHVETIHAYTNDQNLLDNFHKKPRRGRGAPVNMVLTSTGAASAISKVIPELSGKLTGNAIRVPTPNVSMAILHLTFKNETNLEELNDRLRKAAFYGDLVEQVHYSSSTEYVSSNAIGSTSTSVVDSPSTIVAADGKSAVIYLWYDNEYGYTCQVVRLAKHVMKVRRYCYY